MKTKIKLASAAMVTALFAPACLHGEDGDLDSPVVDETFLSPEGFSHQGASFQGASFQGASFQGASFQGDLLLGVAFQTFENASGQITNLALNGTSFSGMNASGAPISGAGFVGATVLAFRRDGSPLTLRIDAIQPSPDPDILYYSISYNTGNSWPSLCRDANDNPVHAIPVAGRWDYSSGTATGGDYIADPAAFTFGCRTGVIGKCVEFGYKPWQSIEECNGSECHLISKQHLLQACTRMMRADSCGNGKAHTVEGTLINLYDNFNIQLDASTTLPLEAEWTPDGAKCVKHLRWGTGGQTIIDGAQADITANCPHVQSSEALAACGTATSTYSTSVGFSTPITQRALLRNESAPPP